MNRVVVLSLVVPVLCACGSPASRDAGVGNDAGADVDAGSTVDAGTTVDAGVGALVLCRELAEAYVAFPLRCGTIDAVGAAHRVASLAAQCEVQRQPQLRIDEALARRCIAVMNATPCDQLPDLAQCGAASVGLVSLGGACAADRECNGGFCDRLTCPGTCRAHIAIGQPVAAHERCVPEAFNKQGICTLRVAAGEVCDASHGLDQCTGGGYCLGGRCVAMERVADGASCQGFALCAEGSACVSGTCAKKVNVGESCSSDDACRDHLRCAAGACVAKPRLGQPCDDFNDRCDEGLFCASGASRVCQTQGGVDAACSNDAECVNTFSCVEGRCRSEGWVGDVCTEFSCELPLRCEAATSSGVPRCVANLPAGAACTNPRACMSGDCVNGQCSLPDQCPSF